MTRLDREPSFGKASCQKVLPHRRGCDHGTETSFVWIKENNHTPKTRYNKLNVAQASLDLLLFLSYGSQIETSYQKPHLPT